MTDEQLYDYTDSEGKKRIVRKISRHEEIGTKVVQHAKYVTFQMAEVAVPRELFAAILERIGWFGVPPPLVQRG